MQAAHSRIKKQEVYLSESIADPPHKTLDLTNLNATMKERKLKKFLTKLNKLKADLTKEIDQVTYYVHGNLDIFDVLEHFARPQKLGLNFYLILWYKPNFFRIYVITKVRYMRLRDLKRLFSMF